MSGEDCFHLRVTAVCSMFNMQNVSYISSIARSYVCEKREGSDLYANLTYCSAEANLLLHQYRYIYYQCTENPLIKQNLPHCPSSCVEAGHDKAKILQITNYSRVLSSHDDGRWISVTTLLSGGLGFIGRHHTIYS
jgi:hypothetical protein